MVLKFSVYHDLCRLSILSNIDIVVLIHLCCSCMDVTSNDADRLSKSSHGSTKKIFFLVVVAAFIVVGGASVYIALRGLSSPEPVILQESKAFETPEVSVKTPGNQVGFPLETFPRSDEAPSNHYIGTQTLVLKDVIGGNSSGKVIRTIDATLSTHSVEALLPFLEPGSYYALWITNSEGSQISVGGLEWNDVQEKYLSSDEFELPTYGFSFDDLYNTATISMEKQTDDVMETKILEGTFTQ